MIVPNAVLMTELATLLSQGAAVTLRAKGRSMMPYIRDGRDMLVFGPVDGSTIAVGDCVLAKVGEGRYVMHRIVKTEGDKIVLKGDGNLYATETCTRSNVVGLLVAIERNGRKIDPNTKTQRRIAKFQSTNYILIKKIKIKICALLKVLS